MRPTIGSRERAFRIHPKERGSPVPYDSEPGAAITARHELLDPTIVEARARRASILHEHLGEVAPGAQRAVERGLQHSLIDQGFAHMWRDPNVSCAISFCARTRNVPGSGPGV